MQLVHIVEGGERAQMSKRKGEFVTLDELIDDIGVDAARFFMLQRSHDTTLDLDLELARSQSQDNPVYYVQYAHARIASILRKAVAEGSADGDGRRGGRGSHRGGRRHRGRARRARRAGRAGAGPAAARVPGRGGGRPPSAAPRTGSRLRDGDRRRLPRLLSRLPGGRRAGRGSRRRGWPLRGGKAGRSRGRSSCSASARRSGCRRAASPARPTKIAVFRGYCAVSTGAAVRLPALLHPIEEVTLTKAEFVDRLARDGGSAARSRPATPSRRSSTASPTRSPRASPVNFTGLRQVQRRRARAPPGRQSAHRRADHDRRRPGAEVLGRRRAEVQGQGLSGLTAPFADRLAALVEERRSQVCLGLDPDPSSSTPRPAAPGDGPPSEPPTAVAERCRSLIERGGPACVAAKPQLACFERLGAAGLGGARAHRGGGARGRAAGDRRRQARRRAGQRRRLRAGAVRLDADALG